MDNADKATEYIERLEADREAHRLAQRAAQSGPGSTHCEECGEEIPQARRQAQPSATMCIGCQSAAERREYMTARRVVL